jgi:hypothetical protein
MAGWWSFGGTRARLTEVARSEHLRVFFLDSLLDNLGVGVDDWRSKAVRDALQPACALGRETDIAIIGCFHPNKHGETFRHLVSGSSAFNAVNRSSMLLAEHPDNNTRRVLVRGKDNLSAKPPAVEFEIGSHRFNANGHTFDVPVARRFADEDLTIEDLLGRTSATRGRSKVASADELIEMLLPRDGTWHPAKPILAAGADDGLDERTMQRAKERLGVLYRRASTFLAAIEWCWPTTDDAQRSTGGSVGGGNRPTPAQILTRDTHDIGDSENERRERVGSADPDLHAEIDRIAEKFPELAT